MTPEAILRIVAHAVEDMPDIGSTLAERARAAITAPWYQQERAVDLILKDVGASQPVWLLVLIAKRLLRGEARWKDEDLLFLAEWVRHKRHDDFADG